MAKQTRKQSPRLDVPPPGILAFADGGTVRKETADELMARMAAKYGVTAAGPATQQPAAQPATAPVQPPQPKPQQGPGSGIIGILKGRADQIDKAAGYADGGKIKGPGTPTSDSIPATVRETGEPIKVSTGERIVSQAQGVFLEGVAKAAGYESLDAMLEDGTGRPVGPTLKAGKRAAANGMAPELDPFAYRGGPAAGLTVAPGHDDSVKAAIAAPPTLGGAPLARTAPGGTLTNLVAGGITIDPAIASGQSQQFAKPGRNASGIISADSAQSAMDNDMQRTGGVFGGIDMAGANAIMARENKARGEMIDSSIKANGGAGMAILGADANGVTQTDRDNAEKTARWRQDDLIDKASRGNQGVIASAIHANATIDAGDKQNAITIRGQDLGYGARLAAQGLTARGQELGLQRAQERNDVLTRGQDMRANTAADRTASNEVIAQARIDERASRPSVATLSQQRSNAEIDAARVRVAGMDLAEIKRKTANYTATGRENPDYDPTLAKAVTLANRRKVGADDEFDQRQPANPQAGTNDHGYDRSDVAQRFRSERSMDRYKLGNDTPNGVEVLDSSGKVIGHYR